MRLALVMGVFVMVVGLVGVVAPSIIASISRYTVVPLGLYLVALARIAIGLVLISAAPASRLPRTLFVLGMIAVIAGVVAAVISPERAVAIAEWWKSRGSVPMRLVSLPVLFFGGLIVYSAFPGRRAR